MSTKFDPVLCEQLETLCLGDSESPQQSWQVQTAQQLAAARAEVARLSNEVARLTEAPRRGDDGDLDRHNLRGEVTSLRNLCNEYHAAKEPLEKVFEAALAYVRAIETPATQAVVKMQAFADLKRLLDLAMR